MMILSVNHTFLPIRPSKSPADWYWDGYWYHRSQEGNMAPKPASARFAYVFGMVLAVAAIILGITTRNLAAPSASLIYLPDLPLLY